MAASTTYPTILETGRLTSERAEAFLGCSVPQRSLTITEVLEIASSGRGACLEEVAGAILEWAEEEQPDILLEATQEIDAFFATLPDPKAIEEGTIISWERHRKRSMPTSCFPLPPLDLP